MNINILICTVKTPNCDLKFYISDFKLSLKCFTNNLIQSVFSWSISDSRYTILSMYLHNNTVTFILLNVREIKSKQNKLSHLGYLLITISMTTSFSLTHSYHLSNFSMKYDRKLIIFKVKKCLSDIDSTFELSTLRTILML